MDLEQLDILEKKIDELLGMLDSFKKENEVLREKVQIQEGRIADLTSQVEALKTAKENARIKLIALLERLEKVST
jgi:FtsZ-binding cell division protein ZapB